MWELAVFPHSDLRIPLRNKKNERAISVVNFPSLLMEYLIMHRRQKAEAGQFESRTLISTWMADGATRP